MVSAYDIHFSDSEPPVKQLCPNTILVYNDRGTDTANVTWAEPIFTDNVGPVIINQIMGLPSGSLFRVGGTEIRYEAKDGQGNTSPKCTFFVIVEGMKICVFYYFINTQTPSTFL